MNEDLTKKIIDITNDIESVDEKYKESIDQKKSELEKLIDTEKNELAILSSQLKSLDKNIEDFNQFAEDAKKDIADNHECINSIERKASELSSLLNDIEKRLAVLIDALAHYEECKKAIDRFEEQQSSLKIDLNNIKNDFAKLSSESVGNSRLINDISGKINKFTSGIVYKSLIEKDESAMSELLTAVANYVVNNIELKNAMFSKKLVIVEKDKNNQ